MRELVYVGPSRLEWRERVPCRLHAETDAIVRPVLAARCDGDILFLRGGLSNWLETGAALHLFDPALRRGGNFFRGPFAYGHEAIAEVLEVGPRVTRVKKGAIVVVPWALSCGSCPRCRAGLTSHCASFPGGIAAYGFGAPIGGYGGMVSDELLVPYADHMLREVPAGVDPLSIVSASDNLVDAYRTVAPHLARMPGAPVLVIGGAAKSIGLYAAGIAVALGSERVDYVDWSRSRLAAAERAGANPVERRKDERWFSSGPLRVDGYPIVVDASSSTAGLHHAIRSMSPGGICTAVGFYIRRGTPLPLWRMYLNSGTLHVGVSHPSRDIDALLELVARRPLCSSMSETVVAPWNDAPRALLEPATKLVLARPTMGQATSAAWESAVPPGRVN